MERFDGAAGVGDAPGGEGVVNRDAVAGVDEAEVGLVRGPADRQAPSTASEVRKAGRGRELRHSQDSAPVLPRLVEVRRPQADPPKPLGPSRRRIDDRVPVPVRPYDDRTPPLVLHLVPQRHRPRHRLRHRQREVHDVVPRSVRVDPVVVRQLEDEVVLLVPESDHRLGPCAPVRAVAGGLAPRFELLVPEDSEAEDQLVEAEGGTETSDFRDPVERPHVGGKAGGCAEGVDGC
mmetsp:Transcript_27653/g.56680  ORF Transcript_27653/g.56680 Transcript_27653/m.56680 type:complete len:234 (-) Transcript_27653:188-889(-)